MEQNSILLSICIPTYNGASSFLRHSLDILLPVVEKYKDSVDVIVANNCSTDNTVELLQSYSHYSCLKYFTNEKNIGFKGNMKLISDKYADGYYSWMIGDDDIINPFFIDFIIGQLKLKQFDYIYIRSEDKNESLFDSKIYFPESFTITPSNFGQAIDRVSQRGNTLGTFIGSNIYRTDLFREVPKEIITDGFYEFYQVFPNAYILATAFAKKQCAYVAEPGIYAIEKDKAWSTEENLYLIVSKAHIDLYDYCLSLGVDKKDLIRTHKRLLFDNVITGYSRLLRGKKVRKVFFKSVIQSYKYPKIKLLIIECFLRKLTFRPQRKYSI